MNKKEITCKFTYSVYDSIQELSSVDASIIKETKKALDLAYAPYSEFKVGAVIYFEDGVMISGANQENASYPVCLCAEGVVLAQAAVMHPNKKIHTIAITTKHKSRPSSSPIAPCGLCRQSLLEYETRQNSPIRLLLAAEQGKICEIQSVKDILPLQFNTADLL